MHRRYVHFAGCANFRCKPHLLGESAGPGGLVATLEQPPRSFGLATTGLCLLGSAPLAYRVDRRVAASYAALFSLPLRAVGRGMAGPAYVAQAAPARYDLKRCPNLWLLASLARSECELVPRQPYRYREIGRCAHRSARGLKQDSDASTCVKSACFPPACLALPGRTRWHSSCHRAANLSSCFHTFAACSSTRSQPASVTSGLLTASGGPKV